MLFRSFSRRPVSKSARNLPGLQWPSVGFLQYPSVVFCTGQCAGFLLSVAFDTAGNALDAFFGIFSLSAAQDTGRRQDG